MTHSTHVVHKLTKERGLSWRGTHTSSGACPTTQDFVPSATIILERSFDGSGWSELQRKNITGTMTYTEIRADDRADPDCIQRDNTSGAFTFTDTNTSQDNFYYRLRVTNQQRGLLQQFIDYQNLSLISVEERPA